jgi:hypothetical protein
MARISTEAAKLRIVPANQVWWEDESVWAVTCLVTRTAYRWQGK